MKRTIVFALAVVLAAAVSAQSGRYGDQDHSYPRRDDNAGVWNKNDRSWEKNRRDAEFTLMERDRAISRINYVFDRRVEEVKRQRFVRASVKNKQIRLLEKERAAEIREVHKRFHQSNNRYNSKSRRW